MIILIFSDTVKSKYRKKKISILGDSISTLQGYNPDGYSVFYTEDNCPKADINGPDDTWWGKIIKHLDGELLVNCSYSGSWVAKMPDRDQLWYSGCSDERTSALHKGDTNPDIIIVYLGTNDWYFGASPEYNGDIEILKEQSFSYAYNNMLTKLKAGYPEAEIWCCTLNISDIKNDRGEFPFERRGVHMKVYSDIIKASALKNDCKVIDIYPYLFPYDSVDGYHPSAKGMEALAQLMIKEINGQGEKNVRCNYR